MAKKQGKINDNKNKLAYVRFYWLKFIWIRDIFKIDDFIARIQCQFYNVYGWESKSFIYMSARKILLL